MKKQTKINILSGVISNIPYNKQLNVEPSINKSPKIFYKKKINLI